MNQDSVDTQIQNKRQLFCFASRVLNLVGATALVSCCSYAIAVCPKQNQRNAPFYLHFNPQQGQTLSNMTYRVISFYGPDMDDSVVQVPATRTYTFATRDSMDDIKWTASIRMDGKKVLPNVAGDYRQNNTTSCYQGSCSLITNASGPFYNPTFWGDPKGELKPGENWLVQIKQVWELGPPGAQTVTVVSVDSINGIVVLKREGEGFGSFQGGQTTFNMTRHGVSHPVAVRYGKAHWTGQAVFHRGVVVSDELLCNTDVELSSKEVGSVQAHLRQFMSLLQHPVPIA